MSDYRETCLSSKGTECTVCGSSSNVVAHHVDGDRSNNTLENLVPMCRSCHSRVHAGTEGFEEWTEKLGEQPTTGAHLEERASGAIVPPIPQSTALGDDVPWVYTRSNVKEERSMVQFYLRDFVQDAEGQLVKAVADDLTADVSLTDVREAAYVAAMRQPEIVADELERWGFEAE